MEENRKIYFAGSIRGGRADAALYAQIIEGLKAYGIVLTEHIGDESLLKDEDVLTDKQIFERDMMWLRQADFVVAEVTQASMGVGYELAMAKNLGIKTYCLFNSAKNKSLSAMISGDDYFNITYYHSISELYVYFDSIFE